MAANPGTSKNSFMLPALSTGAFLKDDGSWDIPPLGEPGPAGVDGSDGSAGATAAQVAALIYPVGAIYISVDAANPATFLGFGTWAAFGAGRVMVGYNAADADFDAAEKTGGAKTHTLTTAEMPAHTHVEYNNSATTGGLAGWAARDTSTSTPVATGYSTGSAGGDGAHSILNPFIVVHAWKRTA